MEPLTILIDEKGFGIFPYGKAFLDRLHDPDYDAVGFAVRNLGFVRLNGNPGLDITVEFHPQNVALLAIQAAKEVLSATEKMKITIRHLDTEWNSETTYIKDEALARIDELCVPYHPLSATDAMPTQEQSIVPFARRPVSIFRDYFEPGSQPCSH